jgi:hypothetical protein
VTTFLTINEDQLEAELSRFFDRFEKAIAEAEPLFTLENRRLEEIMKVLPYHQSHYDQLCKEAHQLVKWLENSKARIEARLTKNYLQGQRVYGARETTTLVSGEKDMVEHNQLIIETTLLYQKLDAIVEAFKQMGWMCGNITKLRVAELQSVVL